jgi:phosphoglycolate phosphatase
MKAKHGGTETTETQSSRGSFACTPHGLAWRDFDAYLFDIDGTLLNSRDAVHYDAFLSALRHLSGRALNLEGITVHGSTDPMILLDALVLAGLNEAEVRAVLPTAMQRMCAEVEARVTELRPELCPSIPELLAELHGARKLLGVTSGNLEPIGWAKLKAAGIAHYFSFGSFSDRNEGRCDIFRWGAERAREVRKGARVCFVGDTPADIAAAKSCGFPVIAVATGIYSLEELLRAEPELCIGACEALLAPQR